MAFPETILNGRLFGDAEVNPYGRRWSWKRAAAGEGEVWRRVRTTSLCVTAGADSGRAISSAKDIRGSTGSGTAVTPSPAAIMPAAVATLRVSMTASGSIPARAKAMPVARRMLPWI